MNCLVVRSDAVKSKVHAAFAHANAEAANMFDGQKREVYRSLKLEGILESPVGICTTRSRSSSS